MLLCKTVNYFVSVNMLMFSDVAESKRFESIAPITFWWSVMHASYNSGRTCFSLTLPFTLGTLQIDNQSASDINLSVSTVGSIPSSDRPYRRLKSSFVLQNLVKFNTLRQGGTSHLSSKRIGANKNQAKTDIVIRSFV